jgi:CubicO group peptidase (beta-lactamase class C family)
VGRESRGPRIEGLSIEKLDEFFHDRIFQPLAMKDTYFALPVEKQDRLAALYTPGNDQTIHRVAQGPIHAGALIYSASYPIEKITKTAPGNLSSVGQSPDYYCSGGAGLVSTITDYHRFLQMLLNRGELEGIRLLEPETVDLMTRSQIGDLKIPNWGHGDMFGYGFGIVTEKGRGNEAASAGTYSWGGIFYTYFWVDPKQELIGIMMTQIYPSNHLHLREDFQRLTYEALAE